MAFASFGIITPVLSIVLSVFMLGLAVGSWGGGRWIGFLTRKSGLSAVVFYGLAELLIGLGAFAVPKLFALGERLLLTSGEMDSLRYLSLSALVLAVSILPSCICMGTTFPLMMAYIRERDERTADSFSFLYLANVLGAMSGTFTSAAVLVELLGFHHTLWLAAAGNFTIAAISGGLGWTRRSAPRPAAATAQPFSATGVLSGPVQGTWLTRLILFSTGFAAMAMEVVWTRAFTPVLKTQVYSFALIVFTYLGATFLGAWLYRRHLRRQRLFSTLDLMAMLTVAAFLPVLINDPRLAPSDWTGSSYPRSVCVLLISICPFCALLGYLTPGLVDDYAAGHPAVAGQAYAINVLGCILGPLVAGYVLLPWLSERHALILLNLPFAGFYLWLARGRFRPRHLAWGLAAGGVLTWALFFSEDFEGLLVRTEKNTAVRRDHVATVISFGENRQKRLLVNGVGMTALTSLTKLMIDLPLAFHSSRPKSALVICFGMGTTYRSALTWNIDTTAVELVPSVTRAFGFYHADADGYISNALGHIIIDDGRRYLKRIPKKFDVITVDPPPPVEAAGSSLLFSREFYALARQHLNPGGVLQMWFPGGDEQTGEAVVRSLQESFPYVRCFRAVEGRGMHHLASMEPLAQLDARQLAERLPERAKQDLMEWQGSGDASGFLKRVLAREVPVASLLNPDPEIQVTDDRPYNEYYLLRRLKAWVGPSPSRLSAGH